MGRARALRVLVATDHRRCPGEAIPHARALAGPGGAVILASILVVPVSQPMDATLDRAVAAACDVLDRGEHRGDVTDTRLVRARSFARGVLDTLADEAFDVVVLERPAGVPANGMATQVETLMEKAPATLVVIRPAPGPAEGDARR